MTTWISCSDLLPPEEEDVLLIINNEVRIGTRTTINRRLDWWVGSKYVPFEQVTHWMPLPRVPGVRYSALFQAKCSMYSEALQKIAKHGCTNEVITGEPCSTLYMCEKDFCSACVAMKALEE